jgi:hypothetical protein
MNASAEIQMAMRYQSPKPPVLSHAMPSRQRRSDNSGGIALLFSNLDAVSVSNKLLTLAFQRLGFLPLESVSPFVYDWKAVPIPYPEIPLSCSSAIPKVQALLGSKFASQVHGRYKSRCSFRGSRRIPSF